MSFALALWISFISSSVIAAVALCEFRTIYFTDYFISSCLRDSFLLISICLFVHVSWRKSLRKMGIVCYRRVKVEMRIERGCDDLWEF